jgi:hypothetical protein
MAATDNSCFWLADIGFRGEEFFLEINQSEA